MDVKLTVAVAVVLVGLGGLVRGSAGNQLVGEGSVMLAADTTLLVLIVGVGLRRVVYVKEEKEILVRGFHSRGVDGVSWGVG